MEDLFTAVTSCMVGLGLAASCGFRVFVPMLFLSIAVRSGQVQLTAGWDWLGSWAAMGTFAAATLVEVGGYFVPWLDNLLDTMATPAAVVAGVITSAACVSNLGPAIEWPLAVIVGGGAAAAVQSGTVILRGASTATTGGAGNFLVSIAELGLSVVMSALAIVLPILAAVVFCAFAFVVARVILRRRARKAAALISLQGLKA